MFKKDYFIHLIEIDKTERSPEYQEWKGVVRAHNAVEAVAIAKADSPETKKYVNSITRL